MRGFANIGDGVDLAARFIPACAGFWDNNDHFWAQMEVHPRVCGVLSATENGKAKDTGSSPRVRGFVSVCFVGQREVGFIPAYAGF